MNGQRKLMTTRMRTVTELWQGHRVVPPGAYVKPLIHREFGQFAYLLKCLGDEAVAVTQYALENWLRFATRAGIQVGVTPPAEPHIGFLVKHHAVAVNMRRESLAPPPPPKPLRPIPPLPTRTDVPYRMTQADLDEFLAGRNPLESQMEDSE